MGEGIDDSDSVEVARKHVSDRLHDGIDCPVCGSHVQMYRRKIYPKMAKWLRWLVDRFDNTEHMWIDAHGSPIRGGDYAKLLYWGLVKRARDEGSGQAGLWQPTPRGCSFARGNLSVAKYAFVYLGKVEGFSDEKIVIGDILGEE